MRGIFPGLVVLLATTAYGQGAECVATSGTQRSHLVELYTSEGCDSCPPAEKWLTTLRGKPGLAGLELHVTYWDSEEWRDPFDAQAYTDRQKALAKRGNRGQIFTPQIWIDGHVWHNWPKGTPPAFMDKASAPLTMKVTTGTPLRIAFDSSGTGDKDTYRVYAAVTESGLSSNVTGGENKGKKLSHVDVVRAFAGPFSLPHAQTEFTLPEKEDLSKTDVVGFVEDESDGSVMQVVDIPLSACLKP